MHIYLFLFALCNFIVSCYGAASSSAQPEIRLMNNPFPNGLHFYESYHWNGLYITNFFSKSKIKDPFNNDHVNGYGLHVTNGIICEQSLQNDRRKQGFPTEFTLRYRQQDGTWYCGDHYVMPAHFCYRDLSYNQVNEQLTQANNRMEDINRAIHDAPLKKFPEDNCQPTTAALPQDIEIYLELNRFDGPLLPTVGHYFECFPKLRYLSLKRFMYRSNSQEQFNANVFDPGITFARLQERKDPAERFNTNEPRYNYYAVTQQYLNSQANLLGITWDTMPNLPLGTIPPWPAQCIRSKESLTLRSCLNPYQPAELRGRIIDLRNHTIAIDELKNVIGEGNIFVLSAGESAGIPFGHLTFNDAKPSCKRQLSNEQVTEINNHLAQQYSWQRRCLDRLYRYRYYLAAGAAATVTAAYIYNNHHDLVLKHNREIAPIVEKLDLQRNAYQTLKNIIDTANDEQTLAQMTADAMRSILNAQLAIKTVKQELLHLQDIMPYPWTLLHSLIAAIKNSVGKITGIMFGTYVADVATKYFLGYRPYQPSRIHVQNDFHDYFRDRIPYQEVDIQPYDGGRYTQRGHCCHSCDIATFYEHKPRNFDALLLHYDEATEARFKRNQSFATLGAFVGIPFAATLWYAMRQAK
jgi:hypothetical protein